MKKRESHKLCETFCLSVAAALCLFMCFIATLALAETTTTETSTDPAISYFELADKFKAKNPKITYALQSRWIDHDRSKSAAKNCLATMRANGLYDAIEQTWGEPLSAEYGRAIACHEGGGQVGALEYNREKGSGGACSFQIDPSSGYADVAKGIGVSTDEFIDTILTDPVACAKAGHYVISTLVKARGSVIGGLCNYFGGAHYRQFKEEGDCAMEIEIAFVREELQALIEGREPNISRVVQDNPDLPCYGCSTIALAQDGAVTVLNCHDYSMELSSDLAKAAITYQNALKIAVRGAEEDALTAQAEHPLRDGRGDATKNYCIDDINDYFDILEDLLDTDLVGIILGFIAGFLQDLLNAACALVTTAIENVLEMVCLPLPTLGLPNFTLPGLEHVSCDGISLGDYVKVVRGSTSLESLIGSTSSGQVTPGDPAYTSVPRMPYILDRILYKEPAQTLFSF